MPIVTGPQLRAVAFDIFHAAGATDHEARTVGDALVESNLEGHDSHGVIRIPDYVSWMEQKLINLGSKLQIVKESAAFAVIDGNWGWGQVVGREAIEIGIAKASAAGSATITVRDCNHLGRIGDYTLMAAQKGLAAVMFVNTHGGGKLVAPWGGRERRLSANPISIALPRSAGDPIVVDISTCAIAEGKLKVAYNSKKSVPTGCIIDGEGRPTTNPADFYASPEGALLPFGGHKGFALGFVTDILAGAISGAGCSRPDTKRIGNSFLATLVDIGQFRERAEFDGNVDHLIEYVKSSKLAEGFTEILIPGEPEKRERKRREENGIPIDEQTWRQIAATAARYDVKVDLARTA